MAPILRRIVVAALLAAWSFPAAAATTSQSQPAPIVEKAQIARSVNTSAEVAQYAAREQQAPANQNFQGGAYLYIGGSVLAAALLVLLILVLI